MTRGLRTGIRQPRQICFRGQEKKILLHAQDTEFATSKGDFMMPNQTSPTTTTRLSIEGKCDIALFSEFKKFNESRFLSQCLQKLSQVS